MDNESKNKKNKYINEFPLIIMVAVAIIVIILVNVYLSFKPYNTIYTNGFAVLSENMTYNLTNSSSKIDDLDVGVVGVTNGDSIYKQVDSYYVGVEDKKEIDYDYPIYSTDGFTIHTINDNFSLIDRDFNISPGYAKMAITSGIVYNEGDTEPADDIDYILAYLNNSAFIGLQTITIKTAYNEYNIPINSPIYFNTKYINYYVFDGEKFSFNKINDIYYDSLIKLGNVNLTYEEFLLKLNVIKESETKEDDNVKDEVIETPIKQEDDKQDDDTFIKPTVNVDDFVVNVYSIQSNITISDPMGAITSNPTFEIYKSDGKLSLRKKISSSGLFTISGLNPSTEYNIVGTYKYKNKQGLTMVVTFFEGKIITKDISSLEEINLTSNVGDRYSNKLEIKDLTILNTDNEALKGVKKIVLDVWENGKTKKTSFNLSYSNINNLIKGNPTLITTPSSLTSNTVYNYEIKFYDENSNELKTSGKSSGVIQTTKMVPTLKFSSKIDKDTNRVDLDITTQNKDNVYINDYNYKLYSYSGLLIDEGSLSYEDKITNELTFENLDYDTNYKVIVTGNYDLEDGKGLQNLYEEKTFTTANISSVINAWYEEKTMQVTHNSIFTKIYISPKTKILEKNDTEVIVYLKDKDGNDILDNEGNLKYSNSYVGIKKDDTGYYFIENTFEGLDSDTEYILTLKFVVKQIDENLSIEKQLSPNITTYAEESYIEIKYKKLLGETLDLSFDVVDSNKLINDSKVNVEIYEGKFENLDDLNKQYIYRKVINIDNNNEESSLNRTNISLTLDGYSSDYYTIKISAKPYKDMDVEQVLPIKSNLEDTNLIIVDRNTSAKTEMYQQLKSTNDSNKYLTELNIKYNLGETKANLYVIDCNNNDDENNCKVIGYIDSSSEFKSLNNSAEYIQMDSVDEWNSGRLKFLNNTKENHKLYLTIEKPNVDLSIKGSDSFSKDEIEYLYILNSLDYTTDYELYNISCVDDLFDTKKINTTNETRHYVVTGNLDFKKEDGTYYFNKNYNFYSFKGSIDFQGYKITLYKNNDSNLSLFDNITETAILKNALVYYELDYDSVVQGYSGIVNRNIGTIENFVVHVKQNNTAGRTTQTGLLARYNYGVIKNFVMYLDSDIYTYGIYSSLVTYSNDTTGKIKYGAVISNNDSKIYLTESESNHGTFAYFNNGTISNVYNLTDVLSTEENYAKGTSGIAFISKDNRVSSSIYNTLSVATSTHNSTTNGPNVYSSSGKTSNNYYVDTNVLNGFYKNKFNKKISKASLRNTGVLNVILNTDNNSLSENQDPYTIISGYYPIVNMSEFMKNYQTPIEVSYDLKDSTVDIISTEVIKDNREDGTAKVRVYISNPNKLEITGIKVDKATAQICTTCDDELENGGYDENYQISNLILNLTLDGEKDQALTSYDILNMTYKTSLGDEITKTYYTDSNPRIIDISLYKRVENYEELISAIKYNDNIYMLDNISLNKNTEINSTVCIKDNVIMENCLPTGTYSAKFDGNQKKIDFGNNNIERGYFFQTFTGELKNLQVTNMKLITNGVYIGFIKSLSYAYIYNVDLTDINITAGKIYNSSGIHVYLGSLAARSDHSKFDRISGNNVTIKKDTNINNTKNEASVYLFDAGGIIGYSYDDQISNSYSYNFNFNSSNEALVGYQTVGGIIGYAESSWPSQPSVNNCYSTGKIDTYLSNVGGIIGTARRIIVTNSYSSMDLISQGAYVGGIVGNYLYYISVNGTVTNNLFIGTLTNSNENDPITNLSHVKSNNYTYDDLSNMNKTLKSFTEPDNGIYEQKEEGLNYLPYLLTSSFVEQKVKEEKMDEKKEQEFIYSVEYILDNDCLSKLDETLKEDIDYKNACATSANLYTNKELVVGNNESKNLNIELINQDLTNGNYSYKIEPINNAYYSSYNVELNEENRSERIKVNFFKHVNNINDWDSLNVIDNGNSKKYNVEYQNVLLLDDISIEPDGNIDEQADYKGTKYKNKNVLSVQKWVDNFYGNNKKISLSKLKDKHYTEKDSITYSLIYILNGTMRDVNFNSIKITGQNSENYGIVKFNNGKITKCNFESIDIINNSNKVGIVGTSNGYIDNVTMNNIRVRGDYYVGGLVGYSNSKDLTHISHITNINASNVTIEATTYLGGIAGFVDYYISDIELKNVIIQGYKNDSNLYIKPNSYIGGIVGRGDCKNCTLSSSEDKINIIYISKASIVGGIIGSNYYDQTLRNSKVENLLITSDPNVKNTKESGQSNAVGGIAGYVNYGNSDSATNVVIASTTSEKFGKESLSELTPQDLKDSLSKSDIYEPLNANNVGGIIASGMQGIDLSYLRNSFIYAKSNVGGLVGYTYSHQTNTYGNFVSNSFIAASSSPAGGIVGLYNKITDGAARFVNNIVLNTKISSKLSAGGIIGYFDNSNDYSQNFTFENNYVENCIVEVSEEEETAAAGGIIGKIYKTPQSQEKNYSNSLFYGTLSGTHTGYGFGYIENLESSSYGNIENANDLSIASNFKEYATNKTETYQIDNSTELGNFVGSSSVYTLSNNLYFPYFKVSNYPKIYDDERVPIPTASVNTLRFMTLKMSTLRNYAVAYSAPVNINYNIYASDVDKINIEFTNTNSNYYFYYEIGDYRSDDITIENRVYTIGYDYETPIKIYVSNGNNYKTETIKPNDLSKKISIINGKSYYITDGILYGEDNSYVGGFVNLYNDKALTTDNKVYYISSNEFVDNNISYNLLDTTPLYTFNYNGKIIKTYYNFTMIDNSIQNYQIMVKNGILSIINSNLNNRKNSYIIDYYNNNEIQIVLKNSGELYSLKSDIKYPKDLVNNDIVELFTDIYFQDTIAIVRYKNGGIYSFNYRTGELIFTNITNDISFTEYVKSKLSNDSNTKIIKSVNDDSNYKEMETLKDKIEKISVSEAEEKIMGNNATQSSNGSYAMVYNANTKKYDIYNLEEILNSTENVQSENEKIYKNYELVEFYNTVNKPKKEKSLNGIIIFAFSIVSVFIALYILINRKRLRGVS